MTTDNLLQQSVLAELGWEPSIISAHIGVTASDGVVTLTGHVENFMHKQAAENAPRRVKGVKAVVEELIVKLPFNTKKSDAEIAQAAVHHLAWDISVPLRAIMVKIEKGWVTLTGQVDWHYQIEAAEHSIRGLSGVVGVLNNITIKPKVNISDIDKDIIHALDRSWFDRKTIKVSAEGGEIKLKGTTHSWYDRHLAETTAWAAPGATSVVNDITVVL